MVVNLSVIHVKFGLFCFSLIFQKNVLILLPSTIINVRALFVPCPKKINVRALHTCLTGRLYRSHLFFKM